MEQQPSEDGELPEVAAQAEDAGAPGAAVPPGAPTDPEAAALALEAEEIRRLVEAGAGTPEAIRDLAARLREHRAREEAIWRAQVKPALVKEGKGRLRGHRRSSEAPAPVPHESTSSNLMLLGLLILGLVLVVVVAANTSVWVLIVPVIALLVWAWQQGRDASG